ncbi:hypothetical protein [Pendulispora albinea]|uniref:Intradiol ring-cleavage dioxygenases domain-containing protein n=1 Tax=Pendulispora albinea TaxID=2741071 RepID=A0ABZ2LYD0_9BACT
MKKQLSQEDVSKERADEELIGRRTTLALLGGAGALVATGCATAAGAEEAAEQNPEQSAEALEEESGLLVPDCTLTPAIMQGPYFVDERLNRSDIRQDPVTGQVHDGARLALTLNTGAVRNGVCQAVPNVQLDIWQADAIGEYSDVLDIVNQPPLFDNRGKKFLRGYQKTDANGSVQFVTIFPGWYPGRTAHIHVEARIFGSTGRPTFTFITQLYFTDALGDRVYARQDYKNPARDTRYRRVRNSGDSAYSSRTLLTLVADSQGNYTSTYNIGLRIP